MASEGTSGQIPVAGLVQGSQAATTISNIPGSGKTLPAAGKAAASSPTKTSSTIEKVAAEDAATSKASANKASPARATDPPALVSSLNKLLNDSGRPDEYRLQPGSNDTRIQQINPANGAVVGEFSVDEFPALARSIGVSGLLVNGVA